MYYYRHKNKVLISRNEIHHLKAVSEAEAREEKGIVYLINDLDPAKSRRSFCVSHPSLVFCEDEGLDLLRNREGSKHDTPSWIITKINQREISSINILYPNWEDVLEYSFPEKWRINIAGLGDVGGILSAGLKLLGGQNISSLGLFDIDNNKIKRWTCEIGQIMPPFYEQDCPEVSGLNEEELFDCDMFVFCVSVGVPPVSSSVKDVRMAQYEGNSSIIKTYARKARNCGFKGIFSVVSDPVDQLCSVVFKESNTDDSGTLDFKGLAPEQIRGYGLGVMNARAAYYAGQSGETLHFPKEGRVFGPHGQGLIVADSIENYNHKLSMHLTEKTIKANLEVRDAGYKPYIAPALSSGSLSILSTIKGMWHYSATFMGGVFMGGKNRLNKSGTEIETLDIPDILWQRLQSTYKNLESML